MKYACVLGHQDDVQQRHLGALRDDVGQRPAGAEHDHAAAVRARQDDAQREEGVEAGTPPQRPAHAQHPVDAERILQHREVDQGVARRARSQRDHRQREHHRHQDDGGPVRGQQPGGAGGEERAQGAAPAAHADDEATDGTKNTWTPRQPYAKYPCSTGNWWRGELPRPSRPRRRVRRSGTRPPSARRPAAVRPVRAAALPGAWPVRGALRPWAAGRCGPRCPWRPLGRPRASRSGFPSTGLSGPTAH